MASASDVQREMITAWNSRDFAKMRSLLDPAYSYTGPDGKEVTGPDAGMEIAQMYARAFPDGKLEIKRTYTQGDVAIVEMTAHGTHKGELMGIAPTGRPVEILICNIIEVRNGKIYREREYMDMLSMMVQIGAAKPPGRSAGAV